MSDIDNLASEIAKTLAAYGDNVFDEMLEVVEEVSKDTTEQLKTSGDYKDHRGKYRKGFSVKKEVKYRVAKYTVKNKEYRLTHLLEKGHAVNGGSGRTRAFPHWAEAEEKAIAEYESKLVKRIEAMKND